MKKLALFILAGWLLLAGSEYLLQLQSGPSPTQDVAQVVDGSLLVQDVAIRDLDGRVAWRGDVNLAPVLERIRRGESDPHRNDGGVFHNREGLLPDRPSGHYREYVIRTPGINHAGPQRLVVGRDGEVFYTGDHYRSFRKIR